MMPGIALGGIQQQQSCCCLTGVPGHSSLQARSCPIALSVSLRRSSLRSRAHGPSTAGSRTVLQPGLRPVSTRASREPDRVSTLSADELDISSHRDSSSSSQQAPQRSTTTAAQDRPANTQPGSACPEAAAAAASPLQSSTTRTNSSLGITSSSSGQHQEGFGVTAAELRLLVQAGVDDSQADAAGSLITTLTQQLRHKQHHTHKHHAHSHKAAAAPGDAAAAASGGSGGSLGGSLGSVCTDPTAAAAAGESITPSNGAAARSSTNGTAAAAATVAELEPSSSSSSSSSSGVDLSLLPRALASALGSSLSSGLSGSPSDVAARVSAFGSNSLAAAATSSFWQLLLEAASDSTLLLLMAAGAVSLGLAASTGKEAVDFIDGAAILASVAICVTVTAVTNYQKEAKFRQLNSLKENIPVRVVRGGVELTLSCFDLLVGDVLLVEAGDILPADGLLYAGGQIKVDESHLTGESDDVVKEPPSDKAAAAGSNGSSSGSSGLSSCLCMSGSKVLEGFGRMLVLAVGPNSQQGMIQQMVLNGTQQQQQQQPGAAGSSGSSGSSMLREATPLMSRLEDVAGAIGGVGLAAAAAVLAVNSGLYTFELLGAGLSPWTSDSLEAYLSFFITSMTLLVVAVPEGLPLAVTLALAFSVQRMLADNNLVRNLSSCETMAAATAICSDKTGTLTENNMAVVKLVVGGATFNVRPSATTGTAAAAATAAAAIAAGGSGTSLQGSSGFGLLPGSSSSGSSSTRSPTLRSTSSIAASTGTTSEEEGEGQGGQTSPTTTTAAAAAAGASAWQSPTASQNGSSSSGSNGSSVTSISSAVASTSSGEGLSWPPAGSSDTLPPRRKQQQRSSSSSSNVFRPDVLTMVSLSLDGEPLDPLGNSNTTQQQQQQLPPPPAAAAAVENGTVSDSNSDSELLLASTASYLGPAAAAAAGVAGGDGGEGVSNGSSSSSGHSPRLSRAVKQLLADSISLNSTASIRLVDTTAAAGSNGSNDGQQQQQQQEEGSDGEALACAVSSSRRQLDRSGNRTECALLEFGGRLEGRLLPGCGSSEQASRVLQVFPFSSSRKRMSSLVASGAPLVAPGSSGAVGQPARLYVKGAAELLLDSCRLQVSLDGSLAPLPPDQVSALKARCGRGGLRVLALAYKDMLLPPAQQQQQQQGEPGAAGSSSSSSSSRGVDGRGDWQLLSGDDDQSDLVLIGLLALEDPVRAEVPDAIKDCQRAGIAVRMITGDNAATAAAISASCGILTPTLAQQIEEQRLQAAAGAGSNGSSIHTNQQQLIGELRALLADFTAEHNKDGSSSSSSGSSNGSSNGSSSEGVGGWLSGMLEGLGGGGGGGVSGRADPHAGAALMNSVSPDPRLAVLEGPVFRALVLRPDGSTDLQAFATLWPHLRVMARCTPADKFTLVQAVKALRARGELMETIAMTGDGTNDAPALNAADVGFAMAAGTSIAKDASDILLLDNNFRSIVSAVKWGRNVYSSVTKFLQFQLTANVVALVTAAGGALALRSSPLSAVQMLWVNLIMDSLASLALATEAPSDSMLDQPPRVRDGPIITPTVAKSIVGQAALQLAVMAALLGPLGESLTHTATADTAAVTDAAVAAVAAGGAAAAAVVSGVGVDVVAGGHERIEQYTLVFNSFVLMQLFNQVNSRKIHDEPDVLAGLGQQKLFLIILGLELGLQVAIVQAGGRAFSTVPLTATQWGVCVGFGGLTLLLRQALRALPTEPPATPPPTAGGGGQGGEHDSSGSSSRPRWQQQGAVAAVSAAAAAVGSAVAAPVKGVRQLLQGAAAAAGGAGRPAAADSSQQRPQSLPRQHARR